jgi:RHS repeat-associated protein
VSVPSYTTCDDGSARWWPSLTSVLGLVTAAVVLAGGVDPRGVDDDPAAVPSPVVLVPAADGEGTQLGAEPYWSLSSTGLGAGWSLSVNTFTGNLVLSGPVTSVSGRGPAAGDTLTFNSQSTSDSGMGVGWMLASGQSLTENADGGVTWREGDGSRHVFTRDTAGAFVAPPGLHLTLAAVSAGVYSLTDTAGTRTRFEGGRPVSVTDQTGNALTFGYDSSGRLATQTDAGGRKLTYNRDTAGRLTGVSDPAGRVVAFGYDGGRLASVTDPAGNATTFGYDTAGRLVSVTDGRGGVSRVSYDSAGRVEKIADPRTTATTEYATRYGYDTTTATATVTDPAGAASTVVHNSAGNPTSVSDASGVTTTTDWSGNQPVRVADAAGSASVSYDAAGNVTGTSETLGGGTTATTSTAYDSRNNPVAHSDPNGTRVELKYDSRSNLISQVLPVRREADANTYDSHGNTTSATDVGTATASLVRNGNFERIDSAGAPVAWTLVGATGVGSVDGTVSRFGAKSLKFTSSTPASTAAISNLAAVTPGQLLTLQVEALTKDVTGTGVALGVEFYDSAGVFLGSRYTNSYTGSGAVPLLVTATAPEGAAYAAAVLEYAAATGTVNFDGVQVESPVKTDEGHVLSRLDYVDNSSFEFGVADWYAGGATGAVSVVSTTAWGGARSAQITLSTANTAFAASESIGVRAGEPLTLSGLLKLTDIAGGFARVQVQYYDSAGTRLAVHASGAVAGSSDWRRYAVLTTAPTGAVTAVVFVLLSNATGTVHADNVKLVPRATTTYGYDTTGSYLTRQTDPLGASTTYSYDAVGNMTSTVNPAGGTTKVDYDGNDRPVAVTDPAGGVTRYGYDEVGSGVVVRDARSASATDDGYATRYGYDPAHRRMSLTDPLGRATGYTHDAAGRLTRLDNPAGGNVTYSYTAAGRPEQQVLSGGPSFAYGYDDSGNLTTATRSASGEPDLGYTFGYDAAHRVASYTDPWGYRQTLSRDAAGQLTSTGDSDGKTVGYRYGADGRLLAVTDTGGRASEVRYDEAGRPFELISGDGSRTVIAYDANGQPVSIADPKNPAGAVLFYRYDSRGNVTSLVTASGEHRYGYDALSRLTSWTAPNGTVTEYAYDAAGNLTRKGTASYTHDAAGQITNPGFAHDKDGNLTSDGVHSYAYDAAGRLTKVTKTADGSLVASYRYDHRGLRIEKVTPAGTVRYSWNDQEQLVRETDGNGAVLARYTWAGQYQLAAIEKNGATYYPHRNARGDILAVTDASGARVAGYEYGPWGELLSKSGSFDQPWGYAGYYTDAETGLYYVQQRYYSPTLSRFLTEEPLFSDFCTDCGFDAMVDSAPTTSPYAYADNRPLTFVDPDGRAFFVPALVWGAGMLARWGAQKLAQRAAQQAVRSASRQAVRQFERRGYQTLTTRERQAWVGRGYRENFARGHEIHRRTADILGRGRVQYNTSRAPDYRFRHGQRVELKGSGGCGRIANCVQYRRPRR